MALPIRTTLSDIDGICAYLATKPTGATLAEAKTVLDGKMLDGRKINALKYWELIEENGSKLRLTELGRLAAKNKGTHRSEALKSVAARVQPYTAIIERAAHRGEYTLTATEVAAHWHQHFKNEVSDNDKILNDQAVCFFQIAEGADLGQLTIGRKGQPTRFDFDESIVQVFVERNGDGASELSDVFDYRRDEDHSNPAPTDEQSREVLSAPPKAAPKGNRVFITHGKNGKILASIKEIVAYGKFEPVIAQEHETAAKPVPDKVLDDMRSCHAAVIHVGSEGTLFEKDGKEHTQVNGNVLIEIGAAMALYGRNFILLVEEGVKLPSNLQGLYECRYKGDELSGDATLKLLKAFNEFHN